MKARAFVAFLAAAAASCGAPLMKLPSGPGAPMSSLDAASAYSEAIAACARPRTMTADVGVSGSIDGRRMRGRLSVGIAYDAFIGGVASARVEAMSPFGPPLFVFVTTGTDASLLIPRDSRVLTHSRSSDVLDAVAGVPLEAADLHSVLTGCASEPGERSAKAVGKNWMVMTKPEGDVSRLLYLRREGKPATWRLVAEVRSTAGAPAWRAEYRDFEGGFPRSIHLVSLDARDRFNLTLAMSQLEFDPQLGPDVFALQAPADAVPMTLEELRRNGPLAPQADGR